VNLAEHGKAANPARSGDRADPTARRVRGRSLGTTEKANASGNALDKPTSVGSEMARKYAEPIRTEKANDDRRQSVDASQSCCQRSSGTIRLHSSIAKRLSERVFPAAEPRVNHKTIPGWSYEGLSRMKGNFHVRFLEGGGLATARLYSANRHHTRHKFGYLGFSKAFRLV